MKRDEHEVACLRAVRFACTYMNRLTPLLSIVLSLTFTSSGCAQIKPENPESSQPPHEIWKFDTGG